MHSKRNGFRHYVYSGDTIMFLQPGALRSLDGADTWDYLPATTTSPLSGFYDFACSSHALFAASWTDTHLRRSIDFGETWQPLSLGISFFEYMAVAGNFLYVADGDGIAVSNNHGQSFQGFSTGLANPNDIDGLWEGNRVIFTKSEGQLWRRKGNQWRPASIGLFNETGNLPFIADINGKEGSILLVSEADAHPLFYLSQDDGDSWEGNWEAGLPAIDTDEPFQGLLHNGVIYALGLPQGEFRNRLWKRSLPVPAQEAVSEQNFHLFPNPAKEVVTIDFIAQTVFRGTVILHDFSGHRVWQQEFTGTSQVQIPVKDLPAGIYSASVYSENGKITQAKLVVGH